MKAFRALSSVKCSAVIFPSNNTQGLLIGQNGGSKKQTTYIKTPI